MTPQRVVVTGLGTISALGKNTHEFWTNLSAGVSGMDTIAQVDCSKMRFKYGAEVKNFNGTEYFDDSQLIWLDRFAQFALISAHEAVTNSKIDRDELSGSQTAIITGSCLGGKNTEDQAFARLYREKKQNLHPSTIPNVMANAGASHIAATFGITGPTYTISTACASSTHAIGQAFWLIRQGVVSRAITGGSESPFSLVHLKAWESLRVISPDTCRPFSKNRSGMILGEGGAMLVLESLQSALTRDAHIYAEIVGFGMSADATHLTDPDSSGQEKAIRGALHDALIAPMAINYINAHGTGTIANDLIETKTIQAVFPEAEKQLWINSTKAAHGHLLGATGAVESIATILAIKHSQIPPTLNYTDEDPACKLPLVINKAHSCNIDYALSSSFAFGGLNAALVFRRYL